MIRRGTLMGAGRSSPAPAVILACLFAAAFAAAESPAAFDSASGEDWPVFLGPRGDGTSREKGLIRSFPPEGPPKLWSAEVGNAYSAPVVSRGRLFVFHRMGEEEILDALDAATGKPIWRHAHPTAYEDRYGYNNGPRASPAVDGDLVLAHGAEGVLVCLKFETGEVIWRRDLRGEMGADQGFFGAGVAPVVDGDRVFINVGAPGGKSIVALSKKDGATLWTGGDDEASYSTPLVREINGRRMGLFLTREALSARDAADGRELYRYPFRSKTHESVNAATPVVRGDYVFLSATYNVGAALLKLEPDGLKEIWRDRLAMQNHWATSVLDGDFLYGMDGRHESGSNFRCVEFMTGKIRWTADEGLGRASFVMADGMLIALGERGDLALIRVNPDRYEEICRARVLRYPCWTPPVPSHGLVYARNENLLACFDFRAKP